jgi:hypothetical protein
MKSTPERRFASLATGAIAALLIAAAADPASSRGGRDDSREEVVQSRAPGTPLLAIVALGEQRVTVYDAEGRILRAPVSTGRTGYETPAGIYSVIQKEAEHYSNLYDDASMPYMQRIPWSGIALHAGALPGYPASHGCIRLPHGFAERLFDLTKLGLRVVVAPNDVAPVPITHPALFKPTPVGSVVAQSAQPGDATTGSEGVQPMRLGLAPGDSGVAPPKGAAEGPMNWRAVAAAKAAEAQAATRKAEQARLIAGRLSAEAGRLMKAQRIAGIAKARAETQLTDAERQLEAAGTPEAKERAEAAKARAQARIEEAQAKLDAATAEAQPKAEAIARAGEEAKAAEAARVAAVNAAKEAATKAAPVSGFISRQTQRLYVRQNFQPVLDVPVTIRDADKPIGTHVYTALDYIGDGADVRWNVVSMYAGHGKREPAQRGYGRRGETRSAEPPATDAGAAKAALDRIEIPQEALARISEVVSPGSALIISDEGLNTKETGKGTDFIVLMSGEPQGGIKIRRRPEPWSGYGRPYGRSPYSYPYYGGPFFRW